MPTKSERWKGSSFASHARRSFSSADGKALLLHEHVLRAAEPDPLRAVVAGDLRVARVVGIRPDAEASAGIGPDQQLIEVLVDGRLDHRHRAENDLARRAVDGEQVAFFDLHAIDSEDALLEVDLQALGARDAGLAHAARDHGRVAGFAAARCQHTFGRDHAVDVIGVGLDADQDDGLAFLRLLLRAVGVEDGFSAGGAR